MSKAFVEESGFFGTALGHHMRVVGIRSDGFAAKLQISAEHVRKLLKNESSPSSDLLTRICAALKLSYKQMEEKAEADRLIRKYGDTVWLLYGKNPQLAPLYYVWEFLTKDDRESLSEYVHIVARRNRRKMAAKRRQK